jgi:hypothetical protein
MSSTALSAQTTKVTRMTATVTSRIWPKIQNPPRSVSAGSTQ